MSREHRERRTHRPKDSLAGKEVVLFRESFTGSVCGLGRFESAQRLAINRKNTQKTDYVIRF